MRAGRIGTASREYGVNEQGVAEGRGRRDVSPSGRAPCSNCGGEVEGELYSKKFIIIIMISKKSICRGFLPKVAPGLGYPAA